MATPCDPYHVNLCMLSYSSYPAKAEGKRYFGEEQIRSSDGLEKDLHGLVLNFLQFTAQQLLGNVAVGSIEVVDEVPKDTHLVHHFFYDPFREIIIHQLWDLEAFLFSINYRPSSVILSKRMDSWGGSEYYLEFVLQDAPVGIVALKNINFYSDSSVDASEFLRRQFAEECEVLLSASLFYFDSVIYQEYLETLRGY